MPDFWQNLTGLWDYRSINGDGEFTNLANPGTFDADPDNFGWVGDWSELQDSDIGQQVAIVDNKRLNIGAGIDYRQPFSIFYWGTSSASGTLWGCYQVFNILFTLSVDAGGTVWQFATRNAGAFVITNTIALGADIALRNRFMVFTYDGNGNARIYADGRDVTNAAPDHTATMIDLTASATMIAGRSVDNASLRGNLGFTGLYINRVLGASEVYELYRSGPKRFG